jgi:hypothetical protein
MVARQGLAPNVASHYKDMRPEELLDEQNEDWNDLVEVWSVYEVWERTWFQMTIDTLGKPLRDKADWPIEWEHLPLDILGVNEQMDTPFPVPIMEEVIPIQIELNKLRTIMSLLARNTRRILGAAEGAIDDDELDKLLDGEVVEFIRTTGPVDQALKEIKAGGFPQELLLYDQLLEQDLREIMGQSLMDRAQRINVESAEEAARVGRGGDMHTLRSQQAFEKFIESSVRNYMHGRRQTMQNEELVPILGMEGAAEGGEPFLNVSPEDIHQDMDFKLVTGSTLPRNRDRDAQKALADIQVAGTNPNLHNMPKVYERYWIARGENPAKVLQAPEARQPALPGMEEERGSIDPAAFKALGESTLQ